MNFFIVYPLVSVISFLVAFWLLKKTDFISGYPNSEIKFHELSFIRSVLFGALFGAPFLIILLVGLLKQKYE